MKHNSKLTPHAQHLRRNMTKKNAAFGMSIFETTPTNSEDKLLLVTIFWTFTVRRQSWRWNWTALSIIRKRVCDMMKTGLLI